MGDTIYVDPQSVEQGIYNALATLDLSPLHRAAWVLELQEVERQLTALSRLHPLRDDADAQASERAMSDLWKRRGELLGLLWPPVPLPIKPDLTDEPAGA